MDTTYKVSRVETDVRANSTRLEPVRQLPRCPSLNGTNAKRIQARLFDLRDRELHDIGISRGEIDYVASNRDVDPRGIRSAG